MTRSGARNLGAHRGIQGIVEHEARSTRTRQPRASEGAGATAAASRLVPEEEMAELVTDAWTMVVPKYVAQEYFDTLGGLPPS